MNTPENPAKRTDPNLLAEAAFLDDDALSYGALILSRVIGRALQLEHADTWTETPVLQRRRLAAVQYGKLIDQAIPGRALTSRRIVVLQDAGALELGA
jgi:hypothetical protein